MECRKLEESFCFPTNVNVWCKVNNVVLSGKVMGRRSQRVIIIKSNICKATTVTHTKRIDRNLLRKETSFVCYTSSVLRKSRHMKQKQKIAYCC